MFDPVEVQAPDILPGRPLRPPTVPPRLVSPLRSIAWRAARCTAGLLLGAVATLSALSLAPALVGWSPLVVTSGSMLPAVAPGDVLVVRPGATGVGVGSLVVVPDPARPGATFAHRVVEIDADGRVVTKGDANTSQDNVHTPMSDVVGVTRLVIPYAGRPALLWLRRSPLDLGYWLILGTAVAVVGRPHRSN